MGRIRNWFNRTFGDGSGEPSIVHLGLPPAERFPFGTPAGYGALMSVDYLACEQTKSRSLATLPVRVVQRVGDHRENIDDHPLAILLSGQANECMSSIDLMEWTVLRRDTFGTAYWRVEWWRGQPTAIWPVNCCVTPEYNPEMRRGYRMRYHVSGDDMNPPGTYFAHEVVPIKTAVTKTGIKGESLARLAAEEIGLSIDLERFYSSMLHNGNHQLGHVEIPEGRVPPEAYDRLQAAIEAKAGITESGKTPIFGYGAKWVTDQQTMRDASLIEQQQWVLQQVCRATNVPPYKVYDGTVTTYSGGQQARIDYTTDTVVPEVRAIEQALTPVMRSCGTPDARVKFSLQGLMRGDDASRASFYRELGYLGAYTRADIREYEDMEPIDGLEMPLFPLNYGAVKPDGSVEVYSSTTKEPADGNQTGVRE